MKVVLVRHPAPMIAPGLCYGRLDIEALADTSQIATDPALTGARVVWTSPAARCRGVAEAIAESLTVPLRLDDRLLELDFGAWEGQPWSAIGRDELDRWAADPVEFAPPGGESGAALIARVTNFRAVLDQDCVVVAHGGPLKVLQALLRDQTIDLLAPPPGIGSVTAVTG
jgi:alpha-ribazole phosphatase